MQVSKVSPSPLFVVALSKAQKLALAHCEAAFAAGDLTSAALSSNKAVSSMAAPVDRRIKYTAIVKAGMAGTNVTQVARLLSQEGKDVKLECVKGAKGTLRDAVLGHALLCSEWVKAGSTDKAREARAAHVGANLTWIHAIISECATVGANLEASGLTSSSPALTT